LARQVERASDELSREPAGLIWLLIYGSWDVTRGVPLLTPGAF